ncbi:helix-turn-helix domain-containing protein [Maridesulfovibrio sp.]|uniref:helix-turn-helix domain-containing protein n=1 Tax=Maridesulfovibrio sp. TaxID=2795000 RepID=UPI0039F01645
MDDELLNFDNTFERLKQATKSTSDTALAKCLGLRQGSISGAKQKGKIPPAWFVTTANDFNVSLDWLVYGKGPMRRDQEADQIQQLPKMTRSNYEPDPLSRSYIYPHERLEFLRMQKGWTQENLAATARVPVAKVKELESPSVSEDISAITMIADVLFVSLEWLLTGEGPRQKFAATPQEDGYRQRCEQLEAELAKEREENRALNKEIRELMRENGDLRVELARAGIHDKEPHRKVS